MSHVDVNEGEFLPFLFCCCPKGPILARKELIKLISLAYYFVFFVCYIEKFLLILTSFSSPFASVTTKVTAGAKSFGSFLYSAVNKVGDKVKESVVHNVSFCFSYF